MAADPGERDPGRREGRLGLVHVFAIGAGAMFSSGFFLLPGIAAAETGPSLPLAYLLAGLLVLPTMLSVTELAVAMPRAGGPYHFFRRSMGSTVATIGGLGLWVALVLKAAFALVGIDAYLTLVLDLPSGAVGVGLAAMFTLLNVLGARESAGVQVGLVAVLLVVLAGFVAAGAWDLTGVPADELSEQFSPLFTDGALGLLAATGIVFVAFAGLPQVASVAGEIRDPGRTIPRGIVLALVVATTVYVAGTAVLVALLPADELRGDDTPIATAAEALSLPFALPLIVAAALAAFASTANAGVMSASRYPLALARDGLLWRRFARLSSSGVPVISVVLSGAAVALVVSVFDVGSIAKLASAFVLVSFGMLNASVIILRSSRTPDYAPRFRVAGSPWVPALGVLTSVVLVVDLGVLPALATVALVVVGALWSRLVPHDDTSAGALVAQIHRRRHPVDAQTVLELQEHGPRTEDCAPEMLESVVVEHVEPGAALDVVRTRAAALASAAIGVDAEEVETWLVDTRHPVVEIAQPESEVHLVRVDGPFDDAVVLAWSPGGADDGGRGRVAVAVVVAAIASTDRASRLAALLANQLADDGLRREWTAGASADDVAGLLAEDASRRQGADPVRRRSTAGRIGRGIRS